MSGYTLQPLAWCYDDYIIDSYAVRTNTVYFYVEGSYREMSAADATQFRKAQIHCGTNLIDYAETSGSLSRAAKPA